MMYYCPCPCSDPSDPNDSGDPEENTFLSLPRNLSYVQESYLDAHDVSGRFVYNPCTERKIAVAAANAVTDNNSAASFSANGHLLPHHHQHDDCNYSYSGYDSYSNGFNSVDISSTAWRADGTELEATTTGTGVDHFDLNNLRNNIDQFEGVKSNKRGREGGGGEGEGERGRISEKENNEDMKDECIEIDCSDVKSQRDPIVHIATEATTAQSSAASDFTNCSARQIESESDSRIQSQHCGVNNNSNASNEDSNPDSSSSSKSNVNSQSSSASKPSSSSLSSALSSKSKVLAKAVSSSSPSSFISKVTSLISPKDEANSSSSVNLNSIHRDLELGSSVDAEPVAYDLDGTASCSSQPLLLLRSPDRSGLVMDRGDDVIVISNPDEISSPKTRTTNTASDSVSQPGPECFADEDGGGGDDEEVIVIEYDQSDESISEPIMTRDDGESEMSESSKVLPSSASSVDYTEESTTTTTNGLSDNKNKNDRQEVISDKVDNDKEFIKPKRLSGDSTDSEDAFVEEGVFVNMIDDTDVIEKCVSEISDDTSFSVDSMFASPEEIEPESVDNNEGSNCDESGKSVPRRMSLEEAISKAASDFNKMTMMMYPDVRAASTQENFSSDKSGASVPGTSKEWEKNERLHALSRGSPLLEIPDLSVQITDSDSDSSSRQQNLDLLDPKESPIYEDNEFNFNKRSLRKSSSLKTNKTPPGTPHRKKVVRFADAMGLDLEAVRHVINAESPPKIPASAMADLKQGLSVDRQDVGARYLTACFTQPGASDNFVHSVIAKKVRLENAIITDLTITGFIRVANISFHKSVRVRYSHNGWATFHDIAASYMQNSCDGPTDRFSFSIVAPAHFVQGNRLEFAVSYNAEGTEFWDNNGGENYVFVCFAKTVPTENDREWLHFL